MEFLKHLAELVLAHYVAEILIVVVGGFLTIKLWKPAKRYYKNRQWLSRAVAVGLRNFYPSRESYSVDRELAFDDYIHSAKKSLTYYGHWLAFTVDQHNMLDSLCSMASSGVAVKLVLLRPDLPKDILSVYARYLAEDPAELEAKLVSAWKKIREAKSQMAGAQRRNLQLLSHSEFIPYSAFWFDKSHPGEHILIDMKIYGAARKDAYGMELQPPGGDESSRYPSLHGRYATSLSKLEDRSEVDPEPPRAVELRPPL